jgi:F0F1-type ATP synthase assembly protein I
MASPPPDSDRGDELTAGRMALALVQIGSLLVASVLGGLFAGYGLDRATGLTPLFLFLGLALGILAATAGAYRLVRAYLQK